MWIEIGVGGGGGGTGGGGGFAAGGTIARSGDGTSTIISIPHGLSPTPDLYYALPLNAAARGIISYGIDGTNINLTYPIAPASGSSNLSYVWGAGYVNSASGGFTPTSTTTLTGKTIDFDSNTFPNLSVPAHYTVYKTGSTYKARNNIAGTILSSDTNPAVVLQAAITQGRDVYIASADYTFPAGFTPITWPVSLVFRVHAAKSAKFIVPSGYADAVFKMDNPVSNCEFWGGSFEEASTFSRNWYPFEIKNSGAGGASGNFYNRVGGYRVKQAKAMIKIGNYSPSGWITSDTIHDITGWDCKYAIEFYRDAGATGGLTYKNTDIVFKDIKLQSDAATIRGVLDIQTVDSVVFDNVMIVDLNLGNAGAGARSCNILADARGVKIIGGTVGSSLVTFPELDQSTNQDTDIKGFNNFSRLTRQDFSRFSSGFRYGWASVGSLAFEGVLNGAGTAMAGLASTSVNTVSSTLGHSVRYASGGAVNDRAGRRFTNLAMRILNPRLSIRFRLAQASVNTRAWFGFISGTADPTGDTEANTKEAVLIGYRSTDTNYQAIRNNGSATALYTDTGIPVDNTNLHTIEIMGDGANNRWLWRMDSGGFTAFPDTVPFSTTVLQLVYGIQVLTALTKSVDIADLEIKVDRK